MNAEQGAQILITRCMGVVAGETVLVVVDEKSAEIGQLLFAAASAAGAESCFVQMHERRSHGAEPPAPIAEAMKKADVVLAPTTKSLSHTQARKESVTSGARFASMPGITMDILGRSIAGDYDLIRTISDKVADLMTKAQVAHITTALGTDLEIPLQGREGMPDIGCYLTPGSFGNLPGGEAYAAPVEGQSRGVLVCDGSIGGVGLVDEPVRCRVEDGYVVEISGGKAADSLRRMLEPYGRPALNIAELGVGTNPGAPLSGNTLEDEKVLGTVHIGLGNNKTFGGTVDVPMHTDLVMTGPTLAFDGTVVIRDGRLLI